MRGVRFASAFSRISGIACFSLKGVFGEHHATLQQEGPQLVDHGRSPRDETIADTRHRLKVELVIRLDRNKPHVLSVNGLGNRFSIQEIVLVRLHKRRHELSWNQLYVMALFTQNTTKEVSARPRLHPIKKLCMLAVKAISCFWVNFFRNSTLPVALRARGENVLPRSIPTECICMSMILLEPANTIPHFTVEIKRRTISLMGL
jgi:hypothetical protein